MKSGLLFLAGIMLLFSNVANGDVSLKEEKGKDGTIIQLENKYLKMAILPWRGARIRSLIDKETGSDQVYYNPATNIWGMLDDMSSRTAAKYKYEILTNSKQKASVKFTCESSGLLSYEKIVSIYRDKPLIEVNYKVGNRSQRTFKDFRIRNIIKPGGGDVTREDFRIVPVVDGGVWEGYGTPYSFITNDKIAAPWQGYIDRKLKVGIMISVNYDHLKSYYHWAKGKIFPTFEWNYINIPPGKELSTDFLIVLARGFTGCSDLRKEYMAHLKTEKDGNNVTLTTSINGIWKNLNEVVVKTTIKSPTRVETTNLQDLVFENIGTDKVKTKSLSWKASKKGSYIITQEVFSQGRKLGEYEQPVNIGIPTSKYRAIKPVAKKTKLTSLSDWKKEAAFDIRKEERKKGYLLRLLDKQSSLKKLRIDMGINERTTLPIYLKPLVDIGAARITIKLKSSDNGKVFPVENLKVKIQDFVKAIPWKKDPSLIKEFPFWLRDPEKIAPFGDEKFATSKNKLREIWLLLNTDGVSPGTYHGEVELSSEKGKSETFPLVIKVWPVKRPEKSFINLDLYSFYFLMYRDYKKGIKFLKNINAHGGRCGCGARNFLYPERRIKIRETGKPLTKASITKYRKKFKKYPKLDFSNLDPWMDALIQNNFTNSFELRTSSPSITFITSLSGEKLGTELWNKCFIWYWKEVAEYLNSKGYTDLVFKYLDEITADVAIGKWLPIAILAKKAGWEPTCTFGATSELEVLKKLNPVCDVWVWCGSHLDLFKGYVDSKQLKLSSADSVRVYGGGHYKAPYAKTRLIGWKNWFSNVDVYYHYAYLAHYYWKDHTGDLFGYRLIAHGENGPIDSPAWEGIRDGMNDANYLAMLDWYLKVLDKSAEKDETLKVLINKIRKDEKAFVNKDASYIKLTTKMGAVKRYALEANLQTIMKAKRKTMELINSLKPYIKKYIKPSLLWGDFFLVKEGKPKVILVLRKNASKKDKENAEKLKKMIKQMVNVNISIKEEPSLTPEDKEKYSLILLGKELAGNRMQLDESFPGKGEYIINKIKSPYATDKKIIIIAGPDQEGTAKGTRFFLKFLNPLGNWID